jgi:hypothetical protein
MPKCHIRSHFTVGLSLGVVIWGLALHAGSQADVITHFSEFSSDATDDADLTASAQFSTSGSNLGITINNMSSFSIAQLFFNSDSAVSALSFDPLSSPNPAWSIAGAGASQGLGADGFGRYNWLIDFGSGGSRLGAGITNLSLGMTGVTSEATIATKFSVIPPGDVPAVAATKFEAGPGGDSAFGSAQATQVMIRELRDFSGMVTSVPFSVGGLDLVTGAILLTLDPTANNFFGLDAELLQGYIDATLLLEFPEFASPELLGPDPIRIRIIEDGPVTIEPFEGGDGFSFTAMLTGGGTIEEGIFAGVSFTNVNTYDGEGLFGSLIVSDNTPVSWSLNGSGMVTFPPSLGGLTESIDGSGALNVVPEPSGMLLAALSLLALFTIARQRNHGRIR